MSAIKAPAAAPLLSELKGVGPALSAKLARLNLFNIPDLLFHLPLRYQDRSHIKTVAQLRVGEEVLIEVQVVQAEVVRRRRAMLLCRVKDESGELLLRFFHFSSGQLKQFYSGQRLRCFGEVKLSGGQLEMVHPEYRLQASNSAELESALTPLYPATEGVSQTQLRRLMQQALLWLEQQGAMELPDYLPTELLKSLSLPSLQEALTFLHQPPAETNLTLLMLPE
ncbi:MAG: ATP-dependent DNA helicase RecG, partial [Gammaproteobacteria bacterium]|nr:ATP-dependent DNA helicase RecG [Gammaproteobacteria bacterium]